MGFGLALLDDGSVDEPSISILEVYKPSSAATAGLTP